MTLVSTKKKKEKCVVTEATLFISCAQKMAAKSRAATEASPLTHWPLPLQAVGRAPAKVACELLAIAASDLFPSGPPNHPDSWLSFLPPGQPH